MSLSTPFTTPYYTGGAVSELVPSRFDVNIGGLTFMLDREAQAHQHRSIQTTRTQADTSSEPGLQSINPDDGWSRGQTTWQLGAGQTYRDRAESVEQRYNTSKGVDIWTDYQASLLNDTEAKAASANTNLKMVIAGSRLYFLDGTAVKYTTDPTAASWSLSTVTGTGSNTKLDLASDGYTVWFTDGTSVYSTNTGASSASVLTATALTRLDYVKGRLMGANASGAISYYDGVTTFTSLFTQAAGANFTWVGCAEGRNAIYCAGYAGDKSLVYRLTIKPDGSALDQPIVSAELPDGEIVRSIGSYLGFIFLGTDKGVRYCEADGAGNLTLGAPFGPTGTRCFEGQDRYIWYGWTNYDGTSTGLGRCSPRRFADVEQRVPSYASDLMATTQGTVLSVVTFGSRRYYAVSGVGFYGETATLVSSGTIDMGRAIFGVAGAKTATTLDITFGPSFAGSVQALLATNGSSSFTSLGTYASGASDDTGTQFAITSYRAKMFEVRITLTQGSTTTGPTLTSWLLKAEPAAGQTEDLVWPLIVWEKQKDAADTPFEMNCAYVLDIIKGWRASRTLLSAQEAGQSYSVFVRDYEWHPESKNSDGSAWQGTLVVVAKNLLQTTEL